MKVPGGVVLLDRATLYLPIPDLVASALGLAPQAVLHGIFLLDRSTMQKDRNAITQDAVHPPIGAVVASLLPTTCWSRLLRASFTLAPAKGELRELVARLNELHLYVRALEVTDGFDITKYHMAHGDGGLLGAPSKDSQSGHAVRPTAILTLEMPRQTLDNWPLETRALHDLLREQLIHDTARSTSHSRTRPTTANATGISAREALSAKLPNNIRVDWVSLLQTLAETNDAIEAMERHHPGESPLRRGSQRLTLFAKKVRRRNRIGFSCEPWRKYLDPSLRLTIERSTNPGRNNIAAVISADTEERLLVAEFVPLRHYAVTSFDIVIPAGRLEHLWHEWIYREVSDCDGSILGVRTSARQDGRWAVVSIIARFRFTGENPSGRTDAAPHPDDIAKILNCFRSLKGFPSNSASLPSVALTSLDKAISKHRNEIALGCLDPEDLFTPTNGAPPAPLALLPRKDTTLCNVKLWYRWPGHPDQRYRARFADPVFNFTRPLDLASFRTTYAEDQLEGVNSRLRLVRRICERLSSRNEGSMVLVGAHRAGKTSILNMCVDMINTNQVWKSSSEPQSPGQLVAIKLNAAVTPPHLLFVSILRELIRTQHKALGLRRHPLRKAATYVRSAVSSAMEVFLGTLQSIDLELSIGREELASLGLSSTADSRARNKDRREKSAKEARQDSASKLDRHDLEQLHIEQALARIHNTLAQQEQKWESSESRAKFLRASITCMRIACDELRKSFGDDAPHLAIALDEISESTAWGGEWAFPAWRHLIESSDFSSIRWLFASSTPPSDATGYSPLSNALREYTIDPLTSFETDELLNRFDGPARASGGSVQPATPDLHPVLTHDAREYITWATGRFPYLLQVVCVHVYEQSVCYHIPVISKHLAWHVIRDRAIAELSEYFERQWASLGQIEQEAVVGVVREWAHPLGGRGRELPPNPPAPLSSLVAKHLQRQGIGSAVEGDSQVVPVFAAWLRSRHPQIEDDRVVPESP